MAGTSTRTRIFITLLVVVIVLLAGTVVVYKMDLIPGLNQRVQGLLGETVVEEEENQQIQQEEILREQTSVKGLFPHLISVSEEAVAAARKAAQEASVLIHSKSNLYTVDFFDEATEKEVASADEASGSSMAPVTEKRVEPRSSYTNSYPIVASSADFYDTTVFIDATPALVCLDKETAAETLRIPCEVYPMEVFDAKSQDAPFTHLQSYYFKSKTGNWYEIMFEKGSIAPETLTIAEKVSEKFRFEDEIYASILPTKTSLDFIDAKMNGLLSVSPAVKIPESILYSPEKEPISFSQDFVSPAFVFSPQEQGNYTLGLCDEEGAWIRDNAFVVLYTMAGEALAISLDYVADRPQITTHLSDQELYIACVGFFPDSLIIDAGPSQDFREMAPTSSPADEDAGEIDLEMVELVLDLPESTETTTEIAEDEVLASDIPETLPQRAWFQVKKAP